MADIKKCDCCGAIYNATDTFSGSFMHHKLRVDEPFRKHIDVCPKCGRAVFKKLSELMEEVKYNET